MKLYEYDEALESMYRAAENEDGVDPETGMVLDITQLDQWEKERGEKIENVLLYAEQLIADANDIEDYVKRLQARVKAKKNAAESLKNYVLNSLQTAGEKRFETKRVQATVRIVPGNKTVITDATAIPSQFLRTKVEPDTTAIKAAIKARETVPGAMLVDSVSLTVR